MNLQEPKVEFVPIELNVFTDGSSPCPDWYTQTPVGGGQRCIGSQIDATDCPDWDTWIPYSGENDDDE